MPTYFNKYYPVRTVVFFLGEGRGTTPVNALLHYKMQGITIEQSTTFYERVAGKILVEKIAPSWIIYSEGFSLSRWKYHFKRLIDILFSSILLMVSLPVLLLTALLIKLDSAGPVFYFQERVGQKDRLFRIIKFRSMQQDAEKNGAVWAKENDERVTRVGKVIRTLMKNVSIGFDLLVIFKTVKIVLFKKGSR